jgi:hypothetical protein
MGFEGMVRIADAVSALGKTDRTHGIQKVHPYLYPDPVPDHQNRQENCLSARGI